MATLVVGVQIHSIHQYAIHIFPRSGKHDNDYVKVTHRGVRGKYLLFRSAWESEPDLSPKVKGEIAAWVESNKAGIRKKIKDMK